MHSQETRAFPSVSIIIPARNAEDTLPAALDSALSQDYAGSLEVIVADGSDTSSTVELVRARYPSVRLIPNPNRTLPTGVNRALRDTSSEVIVRCDAHTVLPQGYVTRAVETLERTGAANVGGRQEPVGTTLFERAVATALTSRLGAGDARHRIGGTEGPIDTVYLGTYRRDSLDAVGGYDPDLVRSQDSELNWRLRQRGQTIWFDPELVVFYRPRGSLRALAGQYFNNGRWKSVILRRHPASLRVRQLAAPMLVLLLVASAILFVSGLPAAALVPGAYVATILAGSVVLGIRRRTLSLFLPLALVTMHISWGLGFFMPVKSPKGDLRTRRVS